MLLHVLLQNKCKDRASTLLLQSRAAWRHNDYNIFGSRKSGRANCSQTGMSSEYRGVCSAGGRKFDQILEIQS